jgi:hypothetical protein
MNTNLFILIISIFATPDVKNVVLDYDTNISGGTAYVDIMCPNSTNWISGAVNKPNNYGTNRFYLNLSNPSYFPECVRYGKMRVRIVK